MILAEHVSTVLENALLYEEVTLQKTLAETLLKSIPPGIVATDEDAIDPLVQSDGGTNPWTHCGGRSESTRSKLSAAGLPHFCAKRSKRKQRSARRNMDRLTTPGVPFPSKRGGWSIKRTPLGAVAVVHDLTAEESLRQKQDLVDRAAFWTDLAASMSHEIRNPLVAIKTFAQLLPERFEDADFRKDFNEIVVQEIDRLDKIITQINNFAHPSGTGHETDRLSRLGQESDELAAAREAQTALRVETTLA